MKKQIKIDNSLNKNFIDWVPSLSIIPNKEQLTILELGCGYGTQFLCNNFKKVYSFESSKDDKWFKQTQDLLKFWDNWEGVFYSYHKLGLDKNIEEIKKSNGAKRKEELLFIKGGFYEKLNNFVDLEKIDIVFVDQSTKTRGETVNYFMEKNINIIFYHDSNMGHKIYGWDLIKNFKNYSKWVYNQGLGTTFYYNNSIYNFNQ